MIYTEN